MRKVIDILNRKGASAVAVSPDTKMIDALKIMKEKNIGSILVMDGGEFIGIVTERDYSRKMALAGKDSHKTKVADIMGTTLPAVSPADTVLHCMKLLMDQNTRYLPVFENDQLAGIVSMSDIIREIVYEQQESFDQLQNFLHSNS